MRSILIYRLFSVITVLANATIANAFHIGNTDSKAFRFAVALSVSADGNNDVSIDHSSPVNFRLIAKFAVALVAAAPPLLGGSSVCNAIPSALTADSSSSAAFDVVPVRSGYTFKSPRRQSTYERVAGTPVFSVTSPGGSPYLHTDPYRPGISLPEEANGGTTEAFYFLDVDDASAYMTEMQQQSEGIQVRITVRTMEKALQQASVKEGLPSGQMMGDLMQTVHYRIMPSRRMTYEAGRIDPSFSDGSKVPVFAASGFSNNRGKNIPLFYSIDDLHEAYDTMRCNPKLSEEERGAIPEQPEIIVLDALSILTKIEERRASGGEIEGLKGLEEVQFIPIMTGVRWLKQATAVGDGQARL